MYCRDVPAGPVWRRWKSRLVRQSTFPLLHLRARPRFLAVAVCAAQEIDAEDRGRGSFAVREEAVPPSMRLRAS
jgi:hypothetical protein